MKTIELEIPEEMTKDEVNSLAIGLLRIGCVCYLNPIENTIGFQINNSDVKFEDDK